MKFNKRHIGITPSSKKEMLKIIGYNSIEDLCKDTLAKNIDYNINTFCEMSEQEYENHVEKIGKKNIQTLSLIGQGFYPNYCPSVIRRNILENPCWYTQYTPYQAEISQGRLEALVNFQTMISDLTGLPLANSSLLDAGTAAAEAMSMTWALSRQKGSIFWVDQACHPQT